jgi:hypothetical protein
MSCSWDRCRRAPILCHFNRESENAFILHFKIFALVSLAFVARIVVAQFREEGPNLDIVSRAKDARRPLGDQPQS